MVTEQCVPEETFRAGTGLSGTTAGRSLPSSARALRTVAQCARADCRRQAGRACRAADRVPFVSKRRLLSLKLVCGQEPLLLLPGRKEHYAIFYVRFWVKFGPKTSSFTGLR